MSAGEWTTEDADALRAAVGEFVRAGRRNTLLPGAQATVLGYLDREGPLTMQQLADLSGVRHQSVRETISSLQETGALTAERSEDDRRKVLCQITAAGRDALARDRQVRTRWILQAAQERLTDSEREFARAIPGLLRKLAVPAEPGGDLGGGDLDRRAI